MGKYVANRFELIRTWATRYVKVNMSPYYLFGWIAQGTYQWSAMRYCMDDPGPYKNHLIVKVSRGDRWFKIAVDDWGAKEGAELILYSDHGTKAPWTYIDREEIERWITFLNDYYPERHSKNFSMVKFTDCSELYHLVD